jgi:hypothetical protein
MELLRRRARRLETEASVNGFGQLGKNATVFGQQGFNPGKACIDPCIRLFCFPPEFRQFSVCLRYASQEGCLVLCQSSHGLKHRLQRFFKLAVAVISLSGHVLSPMV